MENLEKTNEQLEQEILVEHGVTQTGDHTYQVVGSKGLPHTVRFDGRTEDGFACLWSCDCDGYKFRGTCKHINQVASANNDVCDQLGYE